MKFKIMTGDNRDTLKTLADNSIDAIVTDPPYGIDFLGKAWDANTGAVETYQECLRVLKPGGHILAFSAARTYHHLAVTLEQAGFEIRDQIMWIYSSGFPKAQDLGKAIQKRQGVEETKPQEGTNAFTTKGMSFSEDTDNNEYNHKKDEVIPTSPEAQQWSGWKTALKPAHEPIALARKPFKGSCIDNVLTHGTGALNIDATRVGTDTVKTVIKRSEDNSRWYKHSKEELNIPKVVGEELNQGRFPSNVLGEILQDDYQKYFYCPKVGRKERHIGFEAEDVLVIGSTHPDDIMNHPLWDPSIGTNAHRFKQKLIEHAAKIPTEQSMLSDMEGYYIDNNGNETKVNGKNIWLPQTGNIYIHGLKEEYRKWCEANNKTPNVGNNHPTVKPVELMKYLIKLITPPGGVVLDPFNGSGSTGMAAVELGFEYIGCELDPAYVAIAEQRIRAWNTPEVSGTTYEELFE
jgi:DNA modification methylase